MAKGDGWRIRMGYRRSRIICSRQCCRNHCCLRWIEALVRGMTTENQLKRPRIILEVAPRNLYRALGQILNSFCSYPRPPFDLQNLLKEEMVNITILLTIRSGQEESNILRSDLDSLRMSQAHQLKIRAKSTRKRSWSLEKAGEGENEKGHQIRVDTKEEYSAA